MELGHAAQPLVVDDEIVAVVYAENIGPLFEDDPSRGDAFELWWVPVEAPERREVMFGVGDVDGGNDAWVTRWDRARGAGEWLYAEFRRDSRA